MLSHFWSDGGNFQIGSASRDINRQFDQVCFLVFGQHRGQGITLSFGQFDLGPGNLLEVVSTGYEMTLLVDEKAASQADDLVFGIVADNGDHGWLNPFDQGGEVLLGLDCSSSPTTQEWQES